LPYYIIKGKEKPDFLTRTIDSQRGALPKVQKQTCDHIGGEELIAIGIE
jgi:hypothetical protein